MTSVSDLVLREEVVNLRAVATHCGWTIREQGDGRFRVGLTSSDGGRFWLVVDASNYPVHPAAFHWSDETGTRLNQPQDTPLGGGFLHGSGRICAPWNRLAYQQVDPRGPHSDWDLAGWKANPKTGGTNTLAAMFLRVQHELRRSYKGRMA